ncbi:MAG: hypothetical protein GWO07_11275, partial [Candidatus Dadabacteria bacterium]|nr:hypothetical protein [Candidatus Dadabacteria bacterium]NIV42128.1 hypothetical protein [Candidatus Dadabacteria bacterium]NIX15861.1 hypothetical protein [Candidatus Dadabacteria bacterium]
VIADLKELKSYPLNSSDNIITTTGVEFDRTESSDGKGSLKVEVETPTIIKLFETGDIDIEKAKLIYRADIKTENVIGSVYLQMWCVFNDKGEYFSRALHDPFTGTADWKVQQTPFFLQEGENPDNIKLNLVINGKGTVWIDDIKLLKAPLY